MDWSTLAANASGGETVGLVCSADGPGLSSPAAAAAAAAARHLQAGMALEDGEVTGEPRPDSGANTN